MFLFPESFLLVRPRELSSLVAFALTSSGYVDALQRIPAEETADTSTAGSVWSRDAPANSPPAVLLSEHVSPGFTHRTKLLSIDGSNSHIKHSIYNIQH